MKNILFALVLLMPSLTTAMEFEDKPNSDKYTTIQRIREIFPYASQKRISDEELWKVYDSTSKKDTFEIRLDSFIAKKKISLKRRSR